MTTSRRERILAIITAILIVAVVLFEFILEPQLNTQKELIARNTDLSLKATVIQNDLRLRNQVEQQYSRIKTQLIRGDEDDHKPRTNDQELGTFAKSLIDLHEKHGLIRKSFTLSGTEEQPSFKVLRLQLEVQGHINRMLGFIQAIEFSPEPWSIFRCDMRAQDQKDIVVVRFEIHKIVAGT